MAKQTLNQFPFNAALNAALKERFSAKFDGATKTWTVGTKAKAEAANALIAEVVGFERDKMIQTGQVAFFGKFNESHPGYLGFHPLTGATWKFVRAELWAKATGNDPSIAKAEFESLKKEFGVE